MKLSEFEELCEMLTACESHDGCGTCPFFLFCALNDSDVSIGDVKDFMNELGKFNACNEDA